MAELLFLGGFFCIPLKKNEQNQINKLYVPQYVAIQKYNLSHKKKKTSPHKLANKLKSYGFLNARMRYDKITLSLRPKQAWSLRG